MAMLTKDQLVERRRAERFTLRSCACEMNLRATFVGTPSPLQRRVPHPLADVGEVLSIPEHQISKALATSVECRMPPEQPLDGFRERAAKVFRADDR